MLPILAGNLSDKLTEMAMAMKPLASCVATRSYRSYERIPPARSPVIVAPVGEIAGFRAKWGTMIPLVILLVSRFAGRLPGMILTIDTLRLLAG